MPAAPERTIRPAQLAPGAIFQGGYEILAALGAGSSGVVYRGRQLSTGQDVAIKVLHLRDGHSAAEAVNAAERFRREMRLGAELRHPNIVPLIDSGEADDGALYAVFQYVPGATLKDVLTAEGTLSIAETVHLMVQVLDALSCAHARGVVHRDLKPENIMLTKTGVRRNAQVVDFGLGGFAQAERDQVLPRITATQEMMGTPCYAAPEQLRGEPPSTRSDLYSWGLIFLECLTGELAVGGGSAQDVVLKQLGPEPVPIPSWLADRHLRRVLETVTAKPVEQRDATIEGLLQALGAVSPAAGVAPSPAAAATDRRPIGERRQLTIVSCGLTLASPGADGVDPEELDALLHAQHAVIAEIAARHGGQVAGALAERLLLAFGYPQAQENDARRAARAALQIAAELDGRDARLADERGLRLESRLGIHTGVVIARELRQGLQRGLSDLVGMTPQVATRLEALAAPGEVLVSAETQHLLRGDLAVEPAGEHVLPGLPGRVAVYRLIAGHRPSSSRDTLSYADPTPLVGRQAALEQLAAQWQQTTAGRGAAVLITGEPGIGKSRLARELRRRVPRDAWLEARCMAETADSPLRPLADLVLGMEESLEALLTRYGFDIAQTLPLFAAFCGLPPDERFPPSPLSPERQKDLTLGALVTLLARVAAERPTVLAFEDLHWADPTTIELATQLVQELRSAAVLGDDPGGRLLLLLTARPEFAAPWPSEDVAPLPLPRLGPAEVETLVRAGLGRDEPLPAGLVDTIVRRADGIPLFVEEVTRVLAGSGRLADSDAGARLGETAADIPVTLRALLMARLDGLSYGARETAQLAAVLGREFRYEVLHAVAGKHEQVLRDDLRRLTDAGLAYHRRSARAETYVFKHALVRDVAYETMLRTTRQELHRRVAATLCQRFPQIEQQHPELIAQHCESGEQPALAAEHWKRAGDRTMVGGSYIESLRHFERGLALVRRLPESPQRLRQELGLIESLGTALLATRGYTAAEVVETFARAAALCEQLRGDVPIRVLHGIWGVHVSRGDRDATARMIPTWERLAQTSSDPVSLIAAHGGIGVRAFWVGDFARAATEMERATTWYRSEGYDRFLLEYGYDGGIYVFGYLMWSSLILGRIDRAVAVRDEMLALAERHRNPYGLAIAFGFSMILERGMGNPAAVLALAERSVPMLTEQKLYMWLGIVASLRGWAMAATGDADGGIGQIQFGLQLLDMIGIRTSYAYYLSCLVEAHLGRGAAADGLVAVDQALAMGQELLDCFYTAELQRLQGELHLLDGDPVAAESCFRSALELAGTQQARSFSLRAATSLAHLLAGRGDRAGARTTLAEPCTWFRDAPPTADVLAARTLLAELA